MKLLKESIHKNQILPGIIVLIAIALRFYHYFQVPFTHDEFSALFRLNFESFSDLISYGVKTDGHPAGVQVFLYYWTSLFGTSEWIVKLPFTILGILSLFLIYKISMIWYNRTVGLISSAFMASMQYTIMYSQIARPYIAGLFFTLLMVYYWCLMIRKPEEKFWLHSVLFIISAALSAYIHHFSLLFAAIVGISGLFIINKKYLKNYILSGIVIFVLYIPHLKIFFYQLHVGGVEGWLGKPRYDFLLQYFGYLFHYSILVYALVTGLVVFGAVTIRFRSFKRKQFLLFISWFLLPFLIGFIYSRNVNAVLQFSVLIFSFPYLFFILFGHIKPQKEAVNVVIVLLILGVNTLTLIQDRKHYRLFYNSIYEAVIKDSQNLQSPDLKVIKIIDSDDRITDYYNNKMNTDVDFVSYRSFIDEMDFKRFLEENYRNYDALYFGAFSSSSELNLLFIEEYFPNIKWQRNYFQGSTFLFDKKEKSEQPATNLDFELKNEKWNGVENQRITDSVSFSGSRSYVYDSNTEWGPAYENSLGNLISNKNDFIDISVKIKPDETLDQVILVAALDTEKKNIYWGGTDCEKFTDLDGNGTQWINCYHAIKLADAKSTDGDLILKIYVWNRGRRNFIIDDFKVYARKGNPVLYGLYEKI